MQSLPRAQPGESTLDTSRSARIGLVSSLLGCTCMAHLLDFIASFGTKMFHELYPFVHFLLD